MKATLEQDTVMLLIDALSAPGWTKTENLATSIKHAYNAGELLVKVLDGTPPLPVEFTDTQVTTIKACLSHHIKEGQVKPSKALFTCIELFKLL